MELLEPRLLESPLLALLLLELPLLELRLCKCLRWERTREHRGLLRRRGAGPVAGFLQQPVHLVVGRVYTIIGEVRQSWAVVSTGQESSRRRDCHFDDAPCLSLLKHLMKVQGGAIK